MEKNDESGRSPMMQAMGLVRFFTRERVIEKYGITPDIEEEFFSECPTAWFSEGEPSQGVASYRESDVDEYVRHFRTPPYVHPTRRHGGSPSQSGEIVAKAVSLREMGDSWKEVAKKVNDTLLIIGHKKHNSESIRKLVERHAPSSTGISGRTDVSRRRPKTLIDLIPREARKHETKD
jgi:hypothetical protein